MRSWRRINHGHAPAAMVMDQPALRLGLLFALGPDLPEDRVRFVPPPAAFLPADLAPLPRFPGAPAVDLPPADRRRRISALRRSASAKSTTPESSGGAVSVTISSPRRLRSMRSSTASR